MRLPFLNWPKVAALAATCLAAQVPPQSPEVAIATYVHRVDADKTLTTLRRMQSYGHPLNPGKDSLLLVCGSDFPSSVIIYYSEGKVVKIIETARTSRQICENTYYLKNQRLLFVEEKQADCHIDRQRVIWFQKITNPYREKDCFFYGRYFFAADSCVAQQEHGAKRFQPLVYNRPFTICQFFPYQAARYLAAFPYSPTPKRR